MAERTAPAGMEDTMPTTRPKADTTFPGTLATDATLDLDAGFIGVRATDFDLYGVPLYGVPVLNGGTFVTAGVSPALYDNEIIGTNADDEGLFGTTGDDYISGLDGNDYLYGLAGTDILDGGRGTDVMVGGTGDDFYYVREIGDIVWEWGGQGIDTVLTFRNTYTLPPAVENLVLVLSGPSSGFGNELDNTLRGTSDFTLLMGHAGNDTIYGEGGDDHLYGEEGNDTIDGGSGHDYMNGGAGNDTYYVDHFDDYVDEQQFYATGIDLVRSSVSHTLFAGVENLELIGTAAISATGNELDNVLLGNSVSNVLRGFGGQDIINGGAGADTFQFGAVDEAGLSRVFCDQLPDFSAAEGDRIDLSLIDANPNVGGNQAFTFIGNDAAFTGAAGEVRYDTAGYVEGDVNGDAIADLFIAVNPAVNPVLNVADFIL
jgi:Ca2+-binding RTX toxin-like protein